MFVGWVSWLFGCGWAGKIWATRSEKVVHYTIDCYPWITWTHSFPTYCPGGENISLIFNFAFYTKITYFLFRFLRKNIIDILTLYSTIHIGGISKRSFFWHCNKLLLCASNLHGVNKYLPSFIDFHFILCIVGANIKQCYSFNCLQLSSFNQS